jgi:hypothetical protein
MTNPSAAGVITQSEIIVCFKGQQPQPEFAPFPMGQVRQLFDVSLKLTRSVVSLLGGIDHRVKPFLKPIEFLRISPRWVKENVKFGCLAEI